MVSGIFSAKGAKEKEGVLTADCADGTDVPSKKVRRGAEVCAANRTYLTSGRVRAKHAKSGPQFAGKNWGKAFSAGILLEVG